MDDFGFGLILAEEARRESRQQPEQPDQSRYAEQSITIERKDFETSAPFVIADEQRQFPIFGNGTLDSLLLITDSADYRISIMLDTPADLVGQSTSAYLDDEHYEDLKSISTEMSAVAAFEADSGKHVLEVGPVEFLDSVRAVVEPGEAMTVTRQRAELTVEQEVQ